MKEQALPRERVSRRRENRRGGDEPRGVDLHPAVFLVLDPRPDDRHVRARLRHADEHAVLRDDLDDKAAADLVVAAVDEPRVVRREVDVDVAVEVLELHLPDDAGRNAAARANAQPLRVVDAGEDVAAAAVRRRQRRSVAAQRARRGRGSSRA